MFKTISSSCGVNKSLVADYLVKIRRLVDSLKSAGIDLQQFEKFECRSYEFKEETITIIPPQESWLDDPLLIVRNNEGKIVFSAIALTGDSCDIEYTDLNKNKTIDAKNKNEILDYLVEILYGRESVYDYTNSYLDCSIKITYDMPNSGIVSPNTYEFKFSSENGPMTILKNGKTVKRIVGKLPKRPLLTLQLKLLT